MTKLPRSAPVIAIMAAAEEHRPYISPTDEETLRVQDCLTA